MSGWQIMLIAMGGALAIEGAAWAVYPAAMRKAYEQLFREMGDRQLHIVGAISVFIGMVMILLAIASGSR